MITQMWSEIKRKFFHLIALIYVLGVIMLPRDRYLLLLSSALLIELALEVSRLRIPSFREWFMRGFGRLLRPEESNQLTGVFWMLLGVLVTVAISRSIPLTVCALLYLILGDGVASLVGMRLRGPHWPGSKKTLSGSLACLIVCLVVGTIILRPDYGWMGVIMGAVVATLVERGFIPINDNFSIPTISALTFLLIY